MSGPSPDDVDTGDLYDRFEPEPLISRTREYVDTIRETIRNPDDAEGWPAIIIPAIVSAVAINYLRRHL